MVINGNDAAIRLAYGEAIDVLMATLDVNEDARSAFAARVRQLQRVGLLKPALSYGRFTYGLVELAAIATAFRMMSAFMLPIVAVRFLTERWPDLVPALVAGIGDAMPAAFWAERDVSPGKASIIMIEGVALSRLGQKAASDSRYDGPLGHVLLCEPDDVGFDGQSEIAAGTVIDARSFMPRLIDELAALDTIVRRQLDDEVDRLRYAVLVQGQLLSEPDAG